MMRFALLLAAATGGACAADLNAIVRDARGQPVADAVVIAVPEAPAKAPVRPRLEEVQQIDQEFVPRVKAVVVGSPVSFPNRDSVRHHVYSFSAAKRFDLPLYVGTPAKPVLFDTPGVVTVGCNIHDWMVGYIYVSESPYFATTDEKGGAHIGSLPAGAYTVRVWHPQLAVSEDSTRRRVELGAALDLEWQVALKPEVRIRRAPTPGRPGRY
ncbi:MAG TPA: methylamine utilization protein [Burkholderiales bacterium]|nr:methylamine utilization protein [Burkholderiales bacterium]